MARDLEKIEDRLSVGHSTRQDGGVLRWIVYHWDEDGRHVIATFPREDDAWGVVSLILENVNHNGFAEEDAIRWAMVDYRALCAGEDEAQRHATWCGAFGHRLDDDSAARQDHAAETRIWA